MKSIIKLLITSIFVSNGVCAQTDLIFKSSFGFVSKMNDTGITRAGEYPAGNNTDCTSATIISPQDCNTGRDFANNDPTDGHAGFSFTKLDATGAPLADQSIDYATTSWACVQDNVTGLMWEIKTRDGGRHDKNDKYTWHNTDPTTNGGASGYDDGGDSCYGYDSNDTTTFCNTQTYLIRVNAVGLCGHQDWRLPNINEFHSIINYGTDNPPLDAGYFPNTILSWYWTSSPSAGSNNASWKMEFNYGKISIDGSSFRYYVRLVRGGQ